MCVTEIRAVKKRAAYFKIDFQNLFAQFCFCLYTILFQIPSRRNGLDIA